MEEADAFREAEVKKKDEAQAVYQALVSDLTEYLQAHTNAFDQTRSVAVDEAKKTLDSELAAAMLSEITAQHMQGWPVDMGYEESMAQELAESRKLALEMGAQ